MSSLETLLKAARYIELQEQQEQRKYQVLRPPSSTASLSSSSLSFINNNNNSSRNYNNSTNINNNSISNGRSNNSRRNVQRSTTRMSPSTPVSPVNATQATTAAATTTAAGTGNFITNGSTMGPSSGTNLIGNNHHTNSNHNSHILGSGNSHDFRHDYAMSLSSNDGRSANLGTTTSSTTQSNTGVTTLGLSASAVAAVAAAAAAASVTSSSSTTSTTTPTAAAAIAVTTAATAIGGVTSLIPNGGVTVAVNGLASGTEDSSQSSLNLSSSGYLSGSSANSSVGAISGNLNTSNSSTSSLTSSNGIGNSSGGLYGHLNGAIIGVTVGNGSSEHHLQTQSTTQIIPSSSVTTTGRRRTTSTNSNGQAGVREVHNKLEKHRRAHLKECFEQLKNQLPLRDEEKKKTSNLAILGAAYRHVMNLKRKERELEQEVEKLAKEKITFQKKILSLKRELASKHDNFDFSSVISDVDIPHERDNLSDTLSCGRGSARYSSSSSLSSTTTMPSPSGSNGMQQSRTISPVMLGSMTSSQHISPNSLTSLHQQHHHQQQHHSKSISPTGNSVPLSLTTKPRGSPTPSIPSPLSNYGIPTTPSSPIVSSSASPSASSISSLSSSPPIGSQSPSMTAISLKTPNVPNGVKISPSAAAIISSSLSLSSVLSSSPSSATSSLSLSSSASPSAATNHSPSSTQSLPSSLTTISSLPVHCTSDNSILTATSLSAATTMPLNLNVAGSHNVQIFHATAAKDLTGKNGICRKTSEISSSLQQHHHQQQQHHSSVHPSSGLIVTAANSGTTVKDKMYDDNEQPAKIIKLLSNGISANSLALSHVANGGLLMNQIPMFPMFGPTGLATIELSTQAVQSRNNQSSMPTTAATSVAVTAGAQLHKLLVSGSTTISTAGTNGTPITSVSSELSRLPGGADINILPATGPRNGKFTILNNGITLKGADGALQVVGPLQQASLAPIVVSQGQGGTHLIASQIGGKMNLITPQYLNSMKPMVVAVASNTPPTLSTVPATMTSAVVTATVATNGSVS